MFSDPARALDNCLLDYTYTKRALPNGLTFVTVEQPYLHRGSIAIYFKNGSRYESEEDNGLSHFLEHMIFRGSENHRSAYELNLAVERLGGTLYAATSPDSTEYELSLPPESLANGVRLLAEIVTRPIFRNIDIERKVIIEEIQEDLDEHGNPIDIDFLSRCRLWPRHPLGQSVTGPLENTRRFKRDDIRRHLAVHYTAENAVLCLSGAYDADIVIPTTESSFVALQCGRNTAEPLTEKPIIEGKGPTAVHAHKPGSQTNVRTAFHGLGATDADRVPLAILMGVFDDGMSTRLHRRIFDELGLAYNIGAEAEMYADTGAINVDATVSHTNVARVIEEVFKLVVGLRDKSVTEEELCKAKQRSIWALTSFLDDPHAMSSWYGEQALHWQPEALETHIERVKEVTADDVMRTAKRIFKRENLHITTVGVQNVSQSRFVEDLANRFC